MACLYKPSVFSLVSKNKISIHLEDESKTRDILKVTLAFINSPDTIVVFVNHWPSRRGGAAASEHKRIQAAKVLKVSIDSLLSKDRNCKIVVLGDFNDGVDDLSVLKLTKDSTMINTSYLLYSDYELGTHKYQDEWNLFDQILISQGLLNGEGWNYLKGSSKIHNDRDWLSKVDLIYGGLKPYRTFSGPNYLGGYSDHYAVSLKLIQI